MCRVVSKRQKMIGVLRFTLLGANLSAPTGTFEDDCPIPKVGCVSSPECMTFLSPPKSCKVFVLPCGISRYQWGHCPQQKAINFVRRSRNSRNQEREANKAGAADMVTSEKHSLPAQMPSSCVGLLDCNPKREIYFPVFFLKKWRFLVFHRSSQSVVDFSNLSRRPFPMTPWGWTDNLILATDSYKYRSLAVME